METIKRKIAALKEDVETKDELISDLQIQLKNEKLEREKSENEASSYKRKVRLRWLGLWFVIAWNTWLISEPETLSLRR